VGLSYLHALIQEPFAVSNPSIPFETASLVPVLTITIADPGPLSLRTSYDDGTQKVVALGCGLLQNSTDWITVVERGIIGACSTIDLARA
jgi:hypothetical protein